MALWVSPHPADPPPTLLGSLWGSPHPTAAPLPALSGPYGAPRAPQPPPFSPQTPHSWRCPRRWWRGRRWSCCAGSPITAPPCGPSSAGRGRRSCGAPWGASGARRLWGRGPSWPCCASGPAGRIWGGAWAAPSASATAASASRPTWGWTCSVRCGAGGERGGAGVGGEVRGPGGSQWWPWGGASVLCVPGMGVGPQSLGPVPRRGVARPQNPHLWGGSRIPMGPTGSRPAVMPHRHPPAPHR